MQARFSFLGIFLAAVLFAAADARAAIASATSGICTGENVVFSPSGEQFRTCSVDPVFQSIIGKFITIVVEKFTRTGKPDVSFGSNGVAKLRSTELGSGHGGAGCSRKEASPVILFPREGGILVAPREFERLYSLRDDGTPNTEYGNLGVSEARCITTDYFPEKESLLSTALTADGGVFAVVAVSRRDCCASTFFRVKRFDASGRLATGFGKLGTGIVNYPGLRLDVGTETLYAWSLLEDGTIEAGYFSASAAPATAAIVELRKQSPTDDSVRTIYGRAMPARGLHFTPDALGSQSLNVYPLPQLKSFVLGDGGLIFLKYQLSYIRPTLHYVYRFRPDGSPDFFFSPTGYQVINNDVLISQPGFLTNPKAYPCDYSLFGSYFLQGDGSIVFDGQFYGQTAGRLTSCPASARSFPMTWKLDANGKLSEGYPQLSDPTQTKPKIERESPAWTSVEYYNPRLDRYFMTPHLGEQRAVDTDVSLADAGWARTGRTFGVWNPDSSLPGTASACRFAADPIVGPKSFYDSILDRECDILREQELATPPGQRAWRYDRESFRATPPVNGVCPSTLVPIYSLYNQGHERGIDSNFRYVDNLNDFNTMIDRGWVGLAQPQFCARPD